MDNALSILTIGLDQEQKVMLQANHPELKIFDVPVYSEFEKLLENTPDTKFIFVSCGPGIAELPSMEIAQAVRSMYADSSIFFVTSKKEGFDRKLLIKNGFTDAFLMPLDSGLFKETVVDQIRKNDPKGPKIYKPVKLIDIQPGAKLDFDLSIYMPMNKKYIKYSGAGDPVDQERVEKLQKHKINSVYVEKSELPKFYEYSANRLAELGKPSTAISETERKDRLQSAVRELFVGIFNDTTKDSNFGSGKEIMNQSQEIVSKYILNNNPGDWYSKLSQAVGESGDTYSHSSRVSSFAALFSIGLQISKPEIMAIAGMFHDLGLSDVPDSILSKPEDQWTADERTLYQLHPEASINVIKARKLIVPEIVMRAILQHHERFDGTGYPKGLPGPRIIEEAQLLGMADQFDYLTRVQEGKPTLTPLQALQQMQNQSQFDPALLRKVRALFPKEDA